MTYKMKYVFYMGALCMEAKREMDSRVVPPETGLLANFSQFSQKTHLIF